MFILAEKDRFLGYIISNGRISLSPKHTEAIKEFPQPRNVHEVQRFIGLTSYFRKFIKDFALKAKPLYNLLKKSSIFYFDESCVEAFVKLKEALSSYPVLRLYNPEAETELHTDASAQGLAAILLQKQNGGNLAPVAYFSQVTNQAESKYHSFELEMLVIVRAIERFHIYLYGIQFTVVTDCNALTYAVNRANLNPRIARWTLLLQNYQFKIMHRPGKQMAHVDALSRQILYLEAMPLERELEYRQLQDTKLKEIANELEFRDDDKFELIEGLIYRNVDRSQFVLSESMINNVIRIYHDDMAHCGFERTFKAIQETYWFPSMRKKIVDYLDNCLTCLLANSSTNANEGEMQIVASRKRLSK